eukprot:8442668-Alexandrium_andersonii.AAC.1
MNGDTYVWFVCAPTGEVKPLDGIMETGMYLNTTTNHVPLNGSGWYFDGTVEQALQYNLIRQEQIKYR